MLSLCEVSGGPYNIHRVLYNVCRNNSIKYKEIYNMGAADFYTSMKLEGTRDELLAMLNVVKSYATEKHEQYKTKKNCEYISSAFVGRFQADGMGKRINFMTDEEMLEVIDANKNVVLVDASGPWGIFGFLEEVNLFRDIAKAAPHAKLSGSISGFDAGGDQDAAYELKDGLLYCKYANSEDEFYDEDDDDDWDDEDDDDWDDEEPDWSMEEVYDPVTDKIIESHCCDDG
jgi:hypothetical protein